MTMKSCMVCGEVSEEARCPEHRGLVGRKGNTTERGYGKAWQKVSVRARRAQPWCSDCGTRKDLTCDHSEEAWRRYERGLPIRLKDVDVVCRSCNSKRGEARLSAAQPSPDSEAGVARQRRVLPTTQGGMP